VSRKRLVGFGLLVTLAGPSWAECTSKSCYDGLAEFLLALAVYALVGIVLLVMVLVRKWRRTGLRGLALVAALAVGVPLLSQAWQRMQLWWMEAGEVLGEPPLMSDRVPLLIAEDWTCESGLCAAVLIGRGATGVHALPVEALEGRDLGAPLILADLPLELWSQGKGGVLRRRLLKEVERAEVAARIDYLILSTQAHYRREPGPLESGLDLGKGVMLRLAMAPLAAGQRGVVLEELDFDLLDLVLTRAALGIPLAPGNWQTIWNDAFAPEIVARSLCAKGGAAPDWACQDAAWR
jgi:hypothetical protein